MPTGPLDRVVQHLWQVAGLSDAQRLSDAQLLERYVLSKDEGAFTTLVRRYGRLVRSVCSHFLHQEADIDDAFQVTFLVFAAKATSIRKSSSVASWLYGVAYRSAMKIKGAAVRRYEKQIEPTGYAREQPMTEAALREVQSILDEEVQRLAEKHRAPFILCCLEGKSRAEAARLLGLKEGTVSSRLAQARKQLRQLLIRRGIMLSAALCAVELSRTTAAASVPPMLLKCTIKGALAFTASRAASVNLVTAEVARLAQGLLHSMFPTTFKIVTVTLLAATLLAGATAWTFRGIAASTLPYSTQSTEPPPTVPTEQRHPPPVLAQAKTKDSVVVSGRVIDPNGKPVVGAKVFYARAVLAFWREPPLPPTPTTTDSEGRFRFRVSRTGYLFAEEKADWLKGGVVGLAPGYGPGWVYNDSVEKLTGVTIKLIKDVPIEGRVLDLEGKPVAGVSVRVRSYHSRDGDLKGWVEALQARKEGHDVHALASMNPAYQLGLTRPVVTGADGTFRLTGIGAERVVTLRFEGPTIATSEVYVVTRPCPTVALPRDKKRPGLGSYVYHGPRFDHVVAPTMPIVGSVRAKDTGKPLAGVTIRAQLYSAYGFHDQDHYICTTTDKEGRYRLVGLPKTESHYLWVTPAAGQPYLPPERKTAGVSFGLDPLKVDFELKRGVLIRGRVTDKDTGQPVAARVEYFAFEDNPQFQEGGVLRGLSFHTPTTPDGSFTLVGLPGRGLLAAKSTYQERYQEKKRYLMDVGVSSIKGPIRTHLGRWSAMQFNTVVEIDPARDAESIHQDIALHPRKTVTGTVVGPDGQPLAGASIRGLYSTVSLRDLPSAQFALPVVNLRSKPEAYFFEHSKRNLASAVVFKGDEPAEFSVKLEPTATIAGRILTEEGEPVPNRFIVGRLEAGQLSVTHPWDGFFTGRTGADGRFKIEGLLAGVKLGEASNLFTDLILQPGEVRKLGNIRIKHAS